MREIQQIKKYLAQQSQDDPSSWIVLATIVRTEGTTYRKPGAVMLLLDEVRQIGLLGGGSLEAQIHRDALKALNERQARLISFDLTDKHEALFGYATGCPGKVDILLEPFQVSSIVDDPARQAAMLGQSQGNWDWTALIWKPGGSSAQLVSRVCGGSDQTVLFGEVDQGALVTIKQAANQGHRGELQVKAESNVNILLQDVFRVPHIHIFGAGADADPLIELIVSLGWDYSIYDHRIEPEDEARFPSCSEVFNSYQVQKPVSPRSAAVLMTHNYYRDGEILSNLSSQTFDYVGLLGSRSRKLQMIEDGIWLDFHVHSPIGLPLGGRSPCAIALAIVAEIQESFFGSHGVGHEVRSKHALEKNGEEPPPMTVDI
ncbi:XdhC family protein [Pseudobacteriovorax antillogorgiicola]|uniref:XdhC and CoxI family protein n=1 Tax=Pseudobacteriovorax antillogorgiicola TaxID=1513793 RepID=A0A1Y6CQQ0_9BACT|nr:XdhC/CoxI family protein [Pseudobacteriovorax antillogorgiicola]TCS42726.1 XdhC/CoxI family protein [Pseudobacteriovorax antillogorgiicola]SMF82424.1 XdhC and CoxI family protein [Pseudobacteriovorax antillogorgiicola]